jgi:DNA-binding NarL/FixJ family response regulator
MNENVASHDTDIGLACAEPPIRLLIVDDHAAFRAATAQFLRTLPRVRVVGEAADGAEALRLSEGLAPDLVLMDLSMPVLDGLEATRSIKARGRGAPRVLIVTLFDGTACHAAVREAGADGFVAKSDLVERLPLLLHNLFAKP